jgi:hypothetical protein
MKRPNNNYLNFAVNKNESIFFILKFIIFLFVIILLLFYTFLVYLEINQIFDVIEIIDDGILQASESVIFDNSNNENTDISIFGLYIELFKTNSSYIYYPSYFVSSSMELCQISEPLSKCVECKAVNGLAKIMFDNAETLRDIFDGLRV